MNKTIKFVKKKKRLIESFEVKSNIISIKKITNEYLLASIDHLCV